MSTFQYSLSSILSPSGVLDVVALHSSIVSSSSLTRIPLLAAASCHPLPPVRRIEERLTFLSSQLLTLLDPRLPPSRADQADRVVLGVFPFRPPCKNRIRAFCCCSSK